MKNLFLTIAFAFACLAVSAQVNVSKKTNEDILNEEYCTGIFKSTPGTIIDVGANPTGGYSNVLNFLEGRVSGLKVSTLRNGDKIALIRGQRVAIFIDEVQVSASYLSAVSVNDIAMVKVIKTSFPASEFNNAAIAVYRFKVEEEE